MLIPTVACLVLKFVSGLPLDLTAALTTKFASA